MKEKLAMQIATLLLENKNLNPNSKLYFANELLIKALTDKYRRL